MTRLKAAMVTPLVLGLALFAPTTAQADDDSKGPFRYKSHVQDVGWTADSIAPRATGTVGLSKRMEAVELWGEELRYAEVRVHVQNIGWMPWTRPAYDRDDPEDFDPFIQVGTTGKSLRLEALQFRTSNGLVIECQAHVQNVGWQPWQPHTCGTTGQSLRVEAVRLRIKEKAE